MTNPEDTYRIRIERSNKRLGLTLGFIAAAFFVGFMLRMVLSH